VVYGVGPRLLASEFLLGLRVVVVDPQQVGGRRFPDVPQERDHVLADGVSVVKKEM